MGADIHLITQVRQPDGTWTDQAPVWTCTACKGTGKYGDLDRCLWCNSTGKCGNYDDRSYRVFSILADVRNYDDIEPIARPRGLPADFTLGDVDEDGEPVGGEKYHAGVWMGDHSFSWLTLAELRARTDWPEGNFRDNFLPALAQLGAPADVRIVFGFDS